MAVEVKLRRGTANQHSTFTGAIGEVTVDITNDTLRIHDGVLTGGHRLAKYTDISGAGANTGMDLALSTPTDGDLANNAAYQNFTTNTKVTDAIDILNQVIDNVRNDTFVKSVTFTADTTSGGAGITVTLTTTVDGTVNQYEIDWGDGSANTVTSDSTPSHTYSTNSGSPFTVALTARNSSGGGEGSSAIFSRTDYIVVYTADPSASFAVYGGSSGGSTIAHVDDGSPVYLDNSTTNIGSATIQYTIQWGDGSANTVISSDTASGGSAGARLAHTFATSTEQEQTYTVNMSLDSHSTANPSTVPDSASSVQIKVYDTHTPEASIDVSTGINASGGLAVTATNSTEATIGSYSAYGIQYLWTWGDGTTTTVNAGSGAAGDTGGAISHTYALSSSDQNNGTSADYTGNLRVISNHTSSPFISSNFSVHLEPELRAAISGVSTTSALKASNDSTLTLYKEADLSGANRAIVSVTNTTKNGNTYTYAWGDSGTDAVAEAGSPNGSVSGSAITHDYQSGSTGNYTVTITANGQPDISGQQDTATTTFVLKNIPSAPAGLSSKSITLSTSAQDTSKLASGFVDYTGAEIAASASLNTSTARRYDTTTSVSTSSVSNVYDSTTGTLTASWDGVADGAKAFTTATGETGTFTSLIVSSEGDAHTELSTTYPQNYYQVFTANITKNISSVEVGAHSLALGHSATGNTNKVYIVKDNISVAPTFNTGSAILQENAAGSYRHVSGIPYYNSGSPSVRLINTTVDNLIGQAYLDSTNIVSISSGTNDEGTSGAAVSTHYRGYSDIDGSSSMLSGGVPIANTGVASSYSLGNIIADLTSSSVNTVERIAFDISNLNGTSSSFSPTTKLQLHKIAPTFNEESIVVSDSLGGGFDTDGARITGFTGATPSFSSSTDYYTDNAWTGAVTVAGTDEAIIRYNTLQHYTTNLSNGYLPIGPDLNTGRSGAQYLRFAFKRTLVQSFKIRLTGKVSGVFIAAPGTNIDSASSLNGWLDTSLQYAGSGVPGGLIGSGGNGSNGCAVFGSDRIIDGTTYSNQAFTFTLGSENLSNAYANQMLVSIKLESGDSLTALSIEAA
tara:strand:+ start:1852 stop:5088 length:3237 start_codon:yes stop_codon:yes gene_type:complete